ncbi:MAG: FmdB family zinc ribbon protein [Planctomycetota bacterium]
MDFRGPLAYHFDVVMPIFEYRCDKCGKISEFLEGASSKPKRKCAHCGSGKLSRQLSVFSAGVSEGDSKRCHGCSDFKCPHAQG